MRETGLQIGNPDLTGDVDGFGKRAPQRKRRTGTSPCGYRVGILAVELR
jgi:hypothetical protein